MSRGTFQRPTFAPVLLVLLASWCAAVAADDEVVVTEVSRQDGYVVEEDTVEGVPVARRVLTRDGLLESQTRYAEGVPVLTSRYRYWSDGSLRTVVRDEADAVNEFRYQGGRLVEEWTVRGSERERSRYDVVGRLVERRVWDQDRLVSLEERFYWTEEPAGVLREVTTVVDGRTETRTYSPAGVLVGSQVTREGVLEADRRRIVVEGRLVAEVEVRSGVEYRVEYEYDGERLALEVSYTDSEKTREVRHLADADGPDRVETLYRDGAAVLRVYSAGGRRLREEVIRDGDVIQTRTFRTEGG